MRSRKGGLAVLGVPMLEEKPTRFKILFTAVMCPIPFREFAQGPGIDQFLFFLVEVLKVLDRGMVRGQIAVIKAGRVAVEAVVKIVRHLLIPDLVSALMQDSEDPSRVIQSGAEFDHRGRVPDADEPRHRRRPRERSEEHTSELQS